MPAVRRRACTLFRGGRIEQKPFAWSRRRQNAALVEQSAAASQALERQAQAMDERMTSFCFDDAQAASGAN